MKLAELTKDDTVLVDWTWSSLVHGLLVVTICKEARSV